MRRDTQKFAQDLVKEVRADYECRREERKPLELQWRLNMNFYNGNQYAEITPVGDIEQYGKQYFWQEREVYNHIASIVEARMSKLNRLKCAVSVRPFSSDDKDVYAAKLSTQIIKALCEENNLPELLNIASSWSEVTGSCFFKTVWSADKGRIIGKSKSGDPIREGDVEITVVPPYEIFPDSVCASSLDECQSIIHAKAYHVDEVKDIWGVDVRGEDVNVFSLDNAQIGGGLGYDASLPNMIDSVAHDMCVVIEKYVMPTSDKPNGELIVVGADKLLYYGELPYVNEFNDGEKRKEISRLGAELNGKLDAYDSQIDKLRVEEKAAIGELDLSYAQKIKSEIDSLLNKREQELKAIETYNNTLREKEAKYIRERAQAIENQLAQRLKDEQELKEMENKNGYAGEKLDNYTERYKIAYEFYSAMPKDVAKQMIQNNASLRAYLGKMFSKLYGDILAKEG